LAVSIQLRRPRNGEPQKGIGETEKRGTGERKNSTSPVSVSPALLSPFLLHTCLFANTTAPTTATNNRTEVISNGSRKSVNSRSLSATTVPYPSGNGL